MIHCPLVVQCAKYWCEAKTGWLAFIKSSLVTEERAKRSSEEKVWSQLKATQKQGGSASLVWLEPSELSHQGVSGGRTAQFAEWLWIGWWGEKRTRKWHSGFPGSGDWTQGLAHNSKFSNTELHPQSCFRILKHLVMLPRLVLNLKSFYLTLPGNWNYRYLPPCWLQFVT